MYRIIYILVILLLSSCSTSNQNHQGHKHNQKHNHKHPHDHGKLNHHKVINHNHIDRGDHIQIIIKHRPRLSKFERKQIRKWCRSHYKHHKKPIKCKFVVVR